jgi:hypothetical protein
MAGTATLLVKRYNGVAWAVLFNSRPLDQPGFLDDADKTIRQAVGEVTSWPSDDLFGRFDEIIILGDQPDSRQKK